MRSMLSFGKVKMLPLCQMMQRQCIMKQFLTIRLSLEIGMGRIRMAYFIDIVAVMMGMPTSQEEVIRAMGLGT